ncbi:MAG: hypothetical protein ACI8V8_002112 [Chitinophagales bacterium]
MGDDLTGGYILKIDKSTNGFGFNWDSPILPPFTTNANINFKLHYPKENKELPVQSAYIENYVTAFENSLNGPDFTDSLLGYRNFIDVSSFIDFFILNEVTRNVDGFRLSTYFYKDKDSKGGKLSLGPLWDFNLAFGNADYCQGSLTTGWGSDFNQNCSDTYTIPFWWNKLKTDTTYINELKCRWDSLRVHQMHTDSIFLSIDSLVVQLDESQERNFMKWSILDSYVWPNNYVGVSYENEITYLKNWIEDRVVWMDDNMPGNCIYVEPEPVDTVVTPIDTTVIPIDSTVSILELNEAFKVQIYPNPAKDIATIAFQGYSINERALNIVDMNGALLHSYRSAEKQVIINLTSYPKGVYFISIVEGDVCVKRKLVKL